MCTQSRVNLTWVVETTASHDPPSERLPRGDRGVQELEFHRVGRRRPRQGPLPISTGYERSDFCCQQQRPKQGRANTFTPFTATRSRKTDGAGGDSVITSSKVQSSTSGAGLSQADMGYGSGRGNGKMAGGGRRSGGSRVVGSGGFGVALPCASAKRSQVFPEVFEEVLVC